MDAATLYVVLTLTDGSQTTATYDYGTVRECRHGAEFLRSVQQANAESPIVSLRCERHRNATYSLYCTWPTRCVHDLGTYTREGCTAMQWVVHMRNPTFMARCWHNKRTDTDDPYAPRKEPEVPDRFDERGMPGMRR